MRISEREIRFIYDLQEMPSKAEPPNLSVRVIRTYEDLYGAVREFG